MPPLSHIRLDVYPAGSELVVFKGKVRVTDGATITAVGTDRALKFAGPTDAPAVLVREDVPGLYDEWDKNSTAYHQARVANGFNGSPYQFGAQDLSQYGSFVDSGCGSMWRPYFTSAAWDPFASGVWTYYGNAGYSWTSPYPWGWTPYHSGSWVNCGTNGWGWQPTGSWAGLGNPSLFRRITGPKPPHPGSPIPPSHVVVGANLLRVSHLDAAHQFHFAQDSAGLGVPRELPVKLSKASQQVASHGTAQAFLPTINLVAASRPGVAAGVEGGAVSHTAPAGTGLVGRPVAVASPVNTSGGAVTSIAIFSPGGSSTSTGSSAAASSSGGGGHH